MALVCNRCGKPLSNPKSIDRGYGAVCWAKVSHEKEKNQQEMQKGIRETNDYPSFQDYFKQIITNERYRDMEICSLHRTKVIDGDFDHYLSEYDGWWLKGWKYQQWLYLECPKCKIAKSFHHLRIDRPFGNIPVSDEVRNHANKTMAKLQETNRKLDWQEARRNRNQANLNTFVEV